MRKLLLSLRRDGPTIHLVAVTIVVGLSCNEFATFIAASAICIPLSENIQEILNWLWLCSAVDIDIPAIRRLARLILWKSDVTILLVAQRDQTIWCC